MNLKAVWCYPTQSTIFLANLPHGDPKHGDPKQTYGCIQKTGFLLSTSGLVTGCFVSPCVSAHRGVSYLGQR